MKYLLQKYVNIPEVTEFILDKCLVDKVKYYAIKVEFQFDDSHHINSFLVN